MAKRHLISGLDIGSGTIKILVAQKKPKQEELEILSFVEKNSSGVRSGVVVEPNEVTKIIKEILKETEAQINQKINSVYVNIGGCHVFSIASRGLVSVSRADQKISQEDVERVLQAAQTISLPSNKEILDVFSREFIIDGERGIKEAIGLRGVRLEAEVLALGGFGPYIKNLTEAVLNSGLEIDDLVFSPIASSRAVLTPKEKELGVALLDIGAKSTGMAIFEQGNLIHLVILPIGSGHITNDIAVGLKCDVDLAERIKLEFGSVFFQGNDKKEKIKLREGESLVFSKKQLARIIEPRILEIFREANKELKKISYQGKLPGGIVLTGGGSKIPKIRDLAKKEFRLPCRLGFPKEFSSFQNDPRFSLVCGLVLIGNDIESESQSLAKGFWKKIGNKIKKFFKIFIP